MYVSVPSLLFHYIAMLIVRQVHVRKVKLLKSPKFDLGALLSLHGDSTTDDQGQKVEKEFKEPTPLESV